ncbi:hypothetical protein ACFYVR_18695 [Rhodococcus sp. NPDC003318]|uniref:hypothetical protein n=1 Tax=Rhodococcus sp. NPDC003318 TaxID=3364503 RepID=UPI0036C2AF11
MADGISSEPACRIDVGASFHTALAAATAALRKSIAGLTEFRKRGGQSHWLIAATRTVAVYGALFVSRCSSVVLLEQVDAALVSVTLLVVLGIEDPVVTPSAEPLRVRLAARSVLTGIVA